MSASAPAAEGTAIAPGYEVLAHLSRGRSLDTYDAWSEQRDCRCVIKGLRPDRRTSEGARARLRQEGRLATELNHPHLVRGYELIVRPDPLAVLETLDGETLEHMIATSARRLSIGDLARLGLQLCSAMHYLHGSGWIHIDLKPSNVIVECGRARVIDLSLARRPGRARRGVGTRSYLAPEQARGERVDSFTDVWGIGATLFEAASGQRPFEGINGTRYPQTERRAPSLSSLRRAPRAFGAAIDACLEPDPSSRPRVSELAELLDTFAD
jgi:serine/threonine protein kinase